MSGWQGVVSAAHVRRGIQLGIAQIPLAEVRDRVHLTAGPNWGYQLRRGLVPLDEHDLEAIRESLLP